MKTETEFKILIVDDAKNSIAELAHILMPMYTIQVAKDGPTALEIAQNKRPDLILLDIIMPQMSGFEVITRLKNSEQTKNIPVIFITGLDSREDIEKGLRLGAVDYITKPFHSFVVKLRVETHLRLLEQARAVEQLVLIDSLTNLPNRRGCDNRLCVEWKRAVRNKTSLGMLLIELDRFKLFKDTHGHAYGNSALKTVANLITRTWKRSTDFSARWSDEEFAILLPETDLNDTLDIAEQIRADVENAVITWSDGNHFHITVSIGASHIFPSITASIDLLVSEATKSLLAAKDACGNTVRPNKTDQFSREN